MGDKMKVLIYQNRGKDKNSQTLNELIKYLTKYEISYEKVEDEDLVKEYKADALFSLGGDGTILYLTKFSITNNIPIIGINTGRLGFLTEFERGDINSAVKALVNKELTVDNRLVISATYKDKTYYALNEIFLHNVLLDSAENMIANIDIKIDNKLANSLRGDGVIICTPTGSTAYSLSAGGPILSPDINAFVITPIAAHSLAQRPIVFNANSECQINIFGNSSLGLFVDGKYINALNENEVIYVKKAEASVKFLRRASFSQFDRLSEKLNYNG